MTAQALSVRTRRGWWLLLLSFAVFFVMLAPAALFDWAMSRESTATLRFTAESGTIWSGHGRVTVASDTSPVVIPVGWRFDPLSVLSLRLGFFIDANAPALAGMTHVGLRLGEIELRDTTIEADASLLSMAHSAAALIAPTGKIRFQQSADERLNLKPATSGSDSWRVEGTMVANAEQLRFGGVINSPVGNHALKLRGDGATINLSILRSSGPLKLEGAGTLALASPRRFTFSGFATAAGDAPAALKQLGPTMADGRQRIEINTAW